MTVTTKRNKTLTVVGTILIGVAVVICGFLIYRLSISNYFSNKAAVSEREQLIASWGPRTDNTQPSPTPPPTVPAENIVSISVPTDQEPFALLYIPRLKSSVWALLILEGVKSKQLNSGVGHYPQSQLPGAEGNFSLFGHRTSYGQPFTNIERLRDGDRVVVETKDFWFVYTLTFDKIVRSNAMWVVSNARVNELGLGIDDPYKVITLVTCESRWSTAKRWVWWGVLSAVHPHDSPPEAIRNNQQ
jgi:sortase A